MMHAIVEDSALFVTREVVDNCIMEKGDGVISAPLHRKRVMLKHV